MPYILGLESSMILEYESSQVMNIYNKLSTNDLKDVFSKITSKKVAVIGDFCLDA